MAEEIRGPYRFTVQPRPVELSGWRLRAYETIPNGEELEVQGNIFPALNGDSAAAYKQAIAAGHDWLAGMPNPEHRDAEHYMMGYFARDAAERIGE